MDITQRAGGGSSSSSWKRAKNKVSSGDAGMNACVDAAKLSVMKGVKAIIFVPTPVRLSSS